MMNKFVYHGFVVVSIGIFVAVIEGAPNTSKKNCLALPGPPGEIVSMFHGFPLNIIH